MNDCSFVDLIIPYNIHLSTHLLKNNVMQKARIPLFRDMRAFLLTIFN